MKYVNTEIVKEPVSGIDPGLAAHYFDDQHTPKMMSELVKAVYKTKWFGEWDWTDVGFVIYTPADVNPDIVENHFIPVTPGTKPAFTSDDLLAMTKDDIEAHGRSVGIELDRRNTKETMVAELLGHMQKGD